MMTRSTTSSVTGRASAMRRLRRRASAASSATRLYCRTNGCASFLDVDPTTGVAQCLICGYVRRPNYGPTRRRRVPRDAHDAPSREARHPRRMTPTRPDRSRPPRGPDGRRDAPVRRRPSALRRAPRTRPRAHSSRACPMPWMVKWAGPFPPYVESASGAHFRCVDGHDYVDFCLGDTGRDGRPRARADDRRRRAPDAPRDHPHAPDRGRGLGRRGADPTVRAAVVAVRAVRHGRQSLRRSASLATSPAVPRSSSTTTATTGRSTRRSRCSTRTARSCPSAARSGRRSTSPETTRVVEFNDVAGLEAALADGDVAAVLIEPALTNVGIVLPEPGYLEAVREITRRTGTLLIIDETHTICAGPGGATAPVGPGARHARHRQDDRRRDPVGGLRVQRRGRRRGSRGSIAVEDSDVGGIGGTLAGLRAVAGRDPGDARRGPDRRAPSSG